MQAVIVGADRVAANGDVANKIGTYGVAVLARHTTCPSMSPRRLRTIDLSAATGADIPIEERDPDELAQFGGRRIVPEGVGSLQSRVRRDAGRAW